MSVKRKKIGVVFGTRPEAIKLAPVILALRKEDWCDSIVCITGQHREMLHQVLQVFQITPDVDLALMQPSQTLGGFTSRAIGALDTFMASEKPDLVLVQGDTTTVFCATLTAFYHHIPVGHVEAGLRTWNLKAPWPEEANRILTTRLAALHFAPTESARQNLIREAIPDSAIRVTGNTVIDALFLAREKVRKRPPEISELNADMMKDSSQLVLVTGHRRENFGDGFEQICLAIGDLARQYPRVNFVYPVHLNPNVRGPVMRALRYTRSTASKSHSVNSNIHLIEPLSYLHFVFLMNRATLILTDSGGVQEEAPSLGKPVLVMRDATERPEAVQAGTVRLVGANRARIVENVGLLLRDKKAYGAMARAINPYGDGNASSRIVNSCERLLFCS